MFSKLDPLLGLHARAKMMLHAGSFGCSCDAEKHELAMKLCATRDNRNVVGNQHLFNVYIHPMPSFGSKIILHTVHDSKPVPLIKCAQSLFRTS